MFFKKLHTYLKNSQSNGATRISFVKNCGEVKKKKLGGGESGGSPPANSPIIHTRLAPKPKKVEERRKYKQKN